MKKLILILTALCFNFVLFSQESNEENNKNNQHYHQFSFPNGWDTIKFNSPITFSDYEFTIPEINFEGMEFNFPVPKIDEENPSSTYVIPEIKIDNPNFNLHIPERTIEIPNFNYEDISVKIPDFKIDSQHVCVQIPNVEDLAELYDLPSECFNYNINKSKSYQKKAKKQLSQSYKVSDNCKLSINNSFGKIEIVEWDKNEILFEVTITGEAKTESKAYDIIECIDVVFAQSSKGKQSIVQASTKTCNKAKNQNDSNYSVDYVVKVPASVYMELTNQFGNIYLGDVQNDLNVKLSFGDIHANKLMGQHNQIYISFGDVEITEVVNCLKLKAQHGDKCVFNTVHLLDADIQFSKIVIENKVDDLTLKVQHSSTSLNEIDEAEIEAQFTNVKINKLNHSLNGTKVQHGNLKVNEVAPNFSEILVNASFGNVNLGLNNKHSFIADLSTSFGNIKLNDITAYHTSSSDKNSKNSNTQRINAICGSNRSTSSLVQVKNQHANIVIGK
ncbi:hypothetical protein LJC69_03095 [Bacteroidales bacterium OttesenSCG-928-K22]|nr:hypothetical protein [Bacteroidales bacterium OttesenSCG-928-L14]MDL2240593.1 hypothetical protein [Bacteroidales bacterium OttesenSCG-928-K22]